MKRVVVTGATGMIGIALINYLIENNFDVLAIIKENSRRKENLKLNSKLTIIECNLENLKNINADSLVKNIGKFDVFYHLGWDGTFGNEREDLEKQKLNIDYTKDATLLAYKLGCTTFIGAGSQAEYGRVEGTINLNTKPNPDSEYGKAKLKACIESRKIANKYNIKHIWTRIFSVYGPYDRENTMVMDSIIQMLKGNSPEYTKGEQDWDYLYSEDVAKMLYYLSEKGINNKIYCLAYGKTKKLFEYINIIKNQINPKIELKLGFKPYNEKQVMNLNVDMTDFKNDIGFLPETEFEDGIRKTIMWYKNERI